MKRSDVLDEYKWNLDDLYTNLDDWVKDFELIDPMVQKLDKYRGHLLDSATNLYNYYQDSQEIERILERLHFYIFLRMDEDLTNSEVSKLLAVCENYYGKYNSKTAFVVPELLASDYEIVLKYMEDLPELRPYKRMFESMYRVKNHILSDNEEKIISEYETIGQYFTSSARTIRNTELNFKSIKDEEGNKVKLTASNISKYLKSSDRLVRKNALKRDSDAYDERIRSLATIYLGYVKNEELQAKLRNYDSLLDRKLFELEIGRNVYENLKKNALASRKYYQDYLNFLKKQLGVNSLKPYDLNAPLGSTSEIVYSINEARDLLYKVFSIYGEEYMAYFKSAFDNHYIDFMPSDNRDTMWYSAYIPYAKPRVFCNFEERVLDVSKMAHELGHFVNQSMCIDSLPSMYVYQTTFNSEVASLANEVIFAFRYLEIETDPAAKKEILANFIKVFANNFFGAYMQAAFEEDVHQAIVDGKSLSAEDLCEICKKHNEYFSDGMVKGKKYLGWAKIPHYFMNHGYYVFNYCTAIVAACSVASAILDGKPGIIDAYLEFLRMGSSMDPVSKLKHIGVDMADSKPYQKALKMFTSAIDEYEKL